MKINFNLILIVLMLFLIVSCSYEPQVHEHKYGSEYVTDENYHWKECECGHVEKVEHTLNEVITPATCEQNGQIRTECKDCGFIFKDETIEALGHDILTVEKLEPTCTEDGHEAGSYCTRCDFKEGLVILEAKGHEHESVITLPTCESQGFTTYTCHCGDSYTADFVDSLGHDVIVTPATSASCTEAGLTKGEKCTRCDYEIKQEVIPALGHDYVSIETKPTCTTLGYTTHTCNTCNDIVVDSYVNELGHDIVVDYAQDATCTETGLTEGEHCSRCEYEIKQEVIPAKGHTGGTATCTSKAVCTVCNKEYGETLEHTYDQMNLSAIYKVSSATCEESAIYYYSCICGLHNDETFEYGEPFGHDYVYVSNGDGTHTKTCTNELLVGVIENCSGGTATCDGKAICEFCQEVYGEVLGHNWGTGEIVNAPTCTTDGNRVYTCSSCFETKEEILPAFGHKLVDEVVEPTCLTKGYTIHTCTNECDYSYTDNEVDETGHSWNQEKTCENGRECTKCNVTEEKLGHDYLLVSTTPATCTTAASNSYKCQRENCSSEYTEIIGSPLGHNIENVEAVERQVEDCEYIEVYVCNTCNEEVLGSTIYNHTYVASIVSDATCCENGQKKLVCEICHDEKFETIEKTENGHKWIEGIISNGKRTDTCEYCNTTKVVTVISGNVTDSINTSDLVDTEIQLDNANINLGQGVIDSIGDKNITVSADKIEGIDRENIGIDADKLAQVGDNPIYNFTINDGNENISQFGEDNYVVITLPYVLGENEDVDSIAVWFINDNGELESISATYNNGYVTFKTNHFSYYTVTRLTPREKCELYGHNYKDEVVEGSCTQDSYVLHVCIVCHETNKEITKVATGHKYEMTTIPATCTTDGKNTYNCENCDHSYEETINATGHNWQIIDQEEASCFNVGFVKYECINYNCNKTYEDIIPMFKHEFSETVIPSTCLDYGFTLYTCDHCFYFYFDNYTAPLGHDFKEVWEWNENYTEAKLTFVCSHDEEHKYEIPAKIKVKEIKATCYEKGRIEYTATAKYNGKKYEDTKFIETDMIVHEDGFRWMSNHNQHWKKCDCGNRIDLEPHNFVDDTIIKEATCKEEGKKLVSCICGQTRIVEIPKLEDHEFVNNECIHCGKEEITCNHETNIVTTYDFAEYGISNSWLKLYQCQCGLNNYIEYNVEYDYDWEQIFYQEDNIAHKVETYNFYNGLTLELDFIRTNEGCYCYEYITYSLSINEENIIDKVTVLNNTFEHHTYEYTYELFGDSCFDGVYRTRTCKNCGYTSSTTYYSHDNFITKEYNLCDFGACYNSNLYIYECACGKERSVSCDLDYYDYYEYEKYVDNNGIPHRVHKYVCDQCNLVFTEDTYTINEGCSYNNYVNYTLTINGEYILDNFLGYHKNNINHSYVYEFGDAIDDNYCNYTAVCNSCGDEQRGAAHIYSTYPIQIIDLSEYGLIDTKIYVEQTPLGNKYINFNSYYEYYEDYYNYFDNNGIEHQVMTLDFIDCELKILKDSYKIVENCKSYICESYDIYLNEVLIYDDITAYYFECDFHNFEYDFTLNGITCKDGGTYTATCKDCGYIEEGSFSSCQTYFIGKEIINNGDDCFIKISYYECACGLENRIEISKNCNMNGTHNSYRDEIGVYHDVWTFDCSDCEFSYTQEAYTEKVGCYEYHFTMYTITNGEKTIVENYRSYEWWDIVHDYEYEFTLNGNTCYDGGTYTSICKDCGHEVTSSFDSCLIFLTDKKVIYNTNECYKEIRFYECACGLQNRIEMSIDCNMSSTHNSYRDENGTYHEVYTYTCSDCNFSYVQDRYYEQVGCYEYYYYNYTIINNGQVIVENYRSYNHRNTKHNYEYEFTLNGNTCSDGGTYTATCKDCGYQTTDSFNSCQTFLVDKKVFNNSNECYKEIRFYECGCGLENRAQLIHECIMDSTHNSYRDENGTMHNIYTYSCQDCSFVYESNEYYVKIGCYNYYYYSYTITNNGQLIVENYRSYQHKNENHNYEYEFTLNGNTCSDGGTYTATCKDCGYVVTSSFNSHNTYIINKYLLKDYNACYGYVYLNSCACGYSQYLSTELCMDHMYSEGFTDKNGIYHNYDYYKCEECEIFIERDTYRVYNSENCTETEYVTYLFQNKSELLLTIKYNNTTKKHDYEITAELVEGSNTCDEGVDVHFQCKYCDDSYTNRYNYHYETIIESIDLSQYGSKCGGTLDIGGCACGEYTNISLDNSLCEFDQQGIECWIEDALNVYFPEQEHYYTSCYQYKCAITHPEKCGLVIRTAYYATPNEGTCTASWYYTVQIGYDEDSDTCLHEFTIDTNYTTHYHNYIENSYTEEFDSGEYSYAYVNEYTCSRCGTNYYENNYYDANGNHVKTYFEYENKLGGNVKKIIRINKWTTFETIDNGSVNKEIEYYYETQYSNGTISWHKNEYTYNPNSYCEYICISTNSDGYYDEYSGTNHYHNYYEEEVATCTQYGLAYYKCWVCGDTEEEFIVEPKGHNWERINGIYVCTYCGLQNDLGATGRIVIEDLTYKYGNNTHYVVGYLDRVNAEHTIYVSLKLHTPLPNGNDEIVLNGLTINALNDITAYSFSKAEVSTLAESLGYTKDMYDVKFSIVPYFMINQLEYAIVLTDNIDSISGDTVFSQFVHQGELVEISVTPTESGKWAFTSHNSNDTYGYLYDLDGNCLVYNDDNGEGNNFYFEYELEAGKTYIFKFRFYSDSTSGMINISTKQL